MGGLDTAGKIARGERRLGEVEFRETEVVIGERGLEERGFKGGREQAKQTTASE